MCTRTFLLHIFPRNAHGSRERYRLLHCKVRLSLDHDATSSDNVLGNADAHVWGIAQREENVPEQSYLTVGQLARKVGTTVRTIQYYDQQGLLSPSAKGPGNQRLYSPEDEKELYRILTLKFLGLSLADIREQRDSVNDVDAFREMLSHTMEALEEDFQNLVKRLSVLRSLLNQTAQDNGVDWAEFARTIEADNATGEFFWHRMGEIAPAPLEEGQAQESPHARGMAVAKWHELIADTISLMSSRVPPNDPTAAQIAQRYAQLEEMQAGSLAQAFILAENVTPHHGVSGSFDVLRDSVMNYLEDAKRSLES